MPDALTSDARPADNCSPIQKSVTAFVASPRGRALALRGLRGELRPGEFFGAACAAHPPAQEQIADSFRMLPENFERAFLQAWSMADQSGRQLEVAWRLDGVSMTPDLGVRYDLQLEPGRITFVVDALVEESAEQATA